MLEMSIDSIRVSPMNYQRVVLLKEKDAERYLPIWIGPAEADAIAVKLQDLSVPRPLTHDLLRTVIDTLGGSLNHILVSDLQNDTFYAKITIQTNGESKEIDCRPSDAVALAVRAKVPIYAEESVMDKAGILLDKETGKPITGDETQSSTEEKPPEVKEEDLRRMSAFTDFIDSLDLEDFGKQQGGR
jgi:bifunctional DNase/RNase